MFGDMTPWFHEVLKRRFLLYSSGKFLDGFFCYLTCSMLENMSYGRIVTSGEWTSSKYNLVVTRTEFWRVWAECSKNGRFWRTLQTAV
jgi:hypothetical protein